MHGTQIKEQLTLRLAKYSQNIHSALLKAISTFATLLRNLCSPICVSFFAVSDQTCDSSALFDGRSETEARRIVMELYVILYTDNGQAKKVRSGADCGLQRSPTDI